ncbi:MAG: universal stress protein [Chloroflexi bacterium]|nr:universal stress protein [Chloroflexota bacterium]MBM3172912.1 universal stress protein [Chloroflexota bacterium]MBM3175242.1 universal stress protein [Chloroflexota bacterium]MBM4451202.1 universal stress protein [Chloroflexota bacterium]
MRPKKVLVAVSGSRADDEVVKLGCDLARKAKATVHIVYVIEVKRSLPLDAVIDSEMKKAEGVLSHAEEVASDRDCDVEADLVQARDVGPAIVDEARERGADLIVLGLDYKRRFGLFSLGRVIPYVIEEAPCRVVICREPMA